MTPNDLPSYPASGQSNPIAFAVGSCPFTPPDWTEMTVPTAVLERARFHVLTGSLVQINASMLPYSTMMNVRGDAYLVVPHTGWAYCHLCTQFV